MKTCSRCKKELPLSDFGGCKGNLDGLMGRCRKCMKEVHKIWAAKNPESRARCRRKYELRKKYGITEKRYNQMFASQKGCCAICDKHQSELQRKLDVDHCHETKRVRGLLCSRCNMFLGQVEADPEWFKRMLEYKL